MSYVTQLPSPLACVTNWYGPGVSLIDTVNIALIAETPREPERHFGGGASCNNTRYACAWATLAAILSGRGGGGSSMG